MPFPEPLRLRLRLPARGSASATVAATLAAGVLIGVGLGPVLDGTSSASGQILVGLPGQEPMAPAPEPDAGALGAPVGNVKAPAPDPPPPAPPAPVAPPAAKEPLPKPSPTDKTPPAGPVEPTPGEDPADESIDIRGTVVQVSDRSSAYVVATRSGELLAVHGRDLPAVGDGVKAKASSLANGTFGETERDSSDAAESATLRGTLTWSDAEAGLYTVSARGASLLVGAQPDSDIPPAGSFVRVEARIEPPAAEGAPRPRLAETALEVESEPFPEQVLEVATVVKQVDAEAGRLAISVDGVDEADRELMVVAGVDVNVEEIEPGQTLIASLDAVSETELVLTGWADDSSRRAADDPERAAGDQALSG